MTKEEILKEKLDELSQHDGSYPSYKNTDRTVKEFVLEAMEDYATQEVKDKCSGLVEALEEILKMRREGDEEYRFVFNRCWNIADEALNEYKQK